MYFLYFILLFVKVSFCKMLQSDKLKFCKELNCDASSELQVCGIKSENKGVRLRLFKNECALLKYGCQVGNNEEYGLINMEYCDQTFSRTSKENEMEFDKNVKEIQKNLCAEFDCSDVNLNIVCGIRQDGKGFRVKLFQNECHIEKYNCERKLNFQKTDFYFCDGLTLSDETSNINENKISKEFDVGKDVNKLKSLVVVDSSLFNINGNINETVDNFFAATHLLNFPMEDVKRSLNDTTRRMLLRIAGPAMVFKPWITIPKNISDDYEHRPTLSSCYHKCPTKCPDTYAPVCGVPGIVAREPSLMFKNHCFMDVAQCKMHWEDKSPTAISSCRDYIVMNTDCVPSLEEYKISEQNVFAWTDKPMFSIQGKNDYIESSFLFCLGDEMNGMFRFLPLVRTLQHMGRLKKKGHFRYKFRNMRFFNHLLSREPKLMG